MSHRTILVPLGRPLRALKSLHYALALAERIQAQVIVVQQAGDATGPLATSDYLAERMLELVNSARQAGIAVTQYVTTSDLTAEIVSLAEQEPVDLVVFGVGDWDFSGVPAAIQSRITSRIIQVTEKSPIDRW